MKKKKLVNKKTPVVEHLEKKILKESGMDIISKVPFLRVITQEIFGTSQFKLGILPHKKLIYVQPDVSSKEKYKEGQSIIKDRKLLQIIPKSLRLDYKVKFVLKLPKNDHVQELDLGIKDNTGSL